MLVMSIGAQDKRCDECLKNEDHHFFRDQVGREEYRFSN